MATEPVELGFVDGLVQLSFSVQSTLGKAAARHDLTVPQIRLLGILRDREPGMLELARYLGTDKSSVTGLIDRAERRGLVRRGSTTDDGRAVRVSTTALGRRMIDRVGAEINRDVTALGRPLAAAEQSMLTELVSRLVTDQPALGPQPASPDVDDGPR
jgi:DNA-binding MarR family transcriptional regulator